MADCQNLPYDDASFDVVSSSVGVIFAPDHARVAHELARVCRPGGRLGLTAWRKYERRRRDVRRDGAVHAAASPGRRLPFQWGEEAYVEAMLGDAFELSPSRSSTRAMTGDDGAEMWEFFRTNFGPSFTLWSSLDEEQRAALDADMTAYFESYRTDDGISVERLYLVVTGVRKG